MRHFALVLLAASSSLCAEGHAATRPRYGGTLHVTTRFSAGSLDPANAAQFGSRSGNNVLSLMFDTLVTLDNRGQPQPSLATSWQSESGGQRWVFKLRHGVVFHDETPLTSDQVAASLRAANSNWKIVAADDEITIERSPSASDLLAELATVRNGILKRSGSKTIGTGPFMVQQADPGKKLTLIANNDYWGGRPYLDSIEITLGQNLREQMLALDLGKADLIEVAPEQAGRAEAEGKRIERSAPDELTALAFTKTQPSADDVRLRAALSLSIDRAAMSKVLLQGGGEPASGLLPNWMTGYSLLFSANADPAEVRQTRGDAHQTAPWTLAYDASDPIARVIAERTVLNAQDAGITLELSAGNNYDLHLVRIPLISVDAPVALAALADSLGLPPVSLANTNSEDLYAAENTLLHSQQVIPLLHLRSDYALGPNVRNWNETPNGEWHLSDLWVSVEQSKKP